MMSPNKPLKLPLAVAEIDRSAHLRSDEAYLQSSWPNALVLQFNSEKFASQSNQLTFIKGASLGEYDSQIDYFLGVKDGENFFLRHLNDETLTSEFKSLRAIGSFLSPRDIGLAVHAQGLANWHSKHPRCSLCGGPTVVVLAGAVRNGPSEESQCRVTHERLRHKRIRRTFGGLDPHKEEMFGDSGILGRSLRSLVCCKQAAFSSFVLPHGLRATKFPFRRFVATNGRFFRNRSFHFLFAPLRCRHKRRRS